MIIIKRRFLEIPFFSVFFFIHPDQDANQSRVFLDNAQNAPFAVTPGAQTCVQAAERLLHCSKHPVVNQT